jgi:hypothetical protein
MKRGVRKQQSNNLEEERYGVVSLSEDSNQIHSRIFLRRNTFSLSSEFLSVVTELYYLSYNIIKEFLILHFEKKI